MSESEIRKGLAGVVADVTAISKVNPETNEILLKNVDIASLGPRSAHAYLVRNLAAAAGRKVVADQGADSIRFSAA